MQRWQFPQPSGTAGRPAGMDQERVPSDPAESGLGGPCLLDDRGRIGESASFGIRVQFAHEDEQFGELLAERQVIVARVSV